MSSLFPVRAWVSIAPDGGGLVFGAHSYGLDGVDTVSIVVGKKHNNKTINNKVEGALPASGLETQEI